MAGVDDDFMGEARPARWAKVTCMYVYIAYGEVVSLDLI